MGEVVRRGRRSTGVAPAAVHELRDCSEDILTVRTRGLRRGLLDGLGEAVLQSEARFAGPQPSGL
eukprot:4096172-Alexandrium_andersonii.AAC.1